MDAPAAHRIPHGLVFYRWMVGLLAAVFLAGCGGKNPHQLVVGMELASPPFDTTDEHNQPSGIDVELARALAGALGKELVIRNTAFDGLIPALQTGKIDGLYTPNGLHNLSRLGKQHMPDLCGACKKMLEDRILQETRALFERLPKLFYIRIDGWGQKMPSLRSR